MRYKLSEIGRIVTGKTPSTKNAAAFSSKINKYLFVTPRDMNISAKIINTTERYLTDEVTVQFKNLILDKNSICVSCIGTVGKVFMVSGLAITNQQINSVTDIKKDICIPDFLYYYLSIHQKDIENLAGGTTMPIVNKTAFESLEVDLPDLETQQKIVRILSALDSKIELNNKQSQTLERLLIEYYKEFYKGLNRDNSSQQTIGEATDCKLGGTPSRTKPEYWGGKIAWINSGAINSFRIDEASEMITDEGFKHTSTYLLPKGTTVLAITGATLGQVSRLEIEACANQSVIGILENDKISNEYIYLNILQNIRNIINKQTGGAQQHINKNDVLSYEIILPSEELMDIFTKTTKPIFEKISNNCFENKNISQLRNALLPKLMNGEIDLGKITIQDGR